MKRPGTNWIPEVKTSTPAPPRTIPLFKVFMAESVLEPLREVLFSGYVTEGEKVREFERRLSAFIGNPYCLTVNSGTNAIQLALRLAGVSTGDEVITTPMTCVATNSPILAAGAKIRWADIDPENGNIHVESIQRNITPKTKAILYVHWAGDPGEVDEINAVAHRHGLKVIEDAAHAFGAEYRGAKVGTHSDFVCFSFQAIKHITTIDGGALFCRDERDYLRGKKLRWFGIDRDARRLELFWDYNIEEYGYKFHMNNVAATIGIEQLKQIEPILETCRWNGAYYLEHLQGIPKLKHLKRPTDRRGAFWLFTVLIQDREAFVELMRRNGIVTSVVHVRNDSYDAFREFRTPLPGVDAFTAQYLSIPCGWWVTPKDAQYIVQTIQRGW